MLDYKSLWALAKRKGETNAALSYPPHLTDKRREKAVEFTWKYYLQYITPPR